MPKHVLLVRGGALGRNTGIGGAHHNLVSSLQNGDVRGWMTQEPCEYPLRKRRNPLSRIYKRWFSHPKRVEKILKKKHSFSAIHITDQEQAHLIPQETSVPVVVTVHDLFHLYPEQIHLAGETIDVGEQKPGWFRRKDLEKLRQGLARADLLVCDSQATLSACQKHYPQVKAVCVPLGLDFKKFVPREQNEVELIGPASKLSKGCHLLIVGSHAPRKRLNFISRIVGELDEDIKQDIHVHHVGNNLCPYGGPSASSYAESSNVQNWVSYGGDVSREALMQLRFASEALFVSKCQRRFWLSAAGINGLWNAGPVLRFTSHNELMPDQTCIRADDIEAWKEAILSVHSNWKRRTKNDTNHVWPNPRTGLIEFASRFDQKRYCQRMAEVYDSLVSD